MLPERLTPAQIHDLLWIGDSPSGQEEHPRNRDLVKLRGRNLIDWTDGRWYLLPHGRLAIHGLTECPHVGKCCAKHTFDYSEKAPPTTEGEALQTLIDTSQGLLDALETTPHEDEREDNVIEVQEAIASAKAALSQEGA